MGNIWETRHFRRVLFEKLRCSCVRNCVPVHAGSKFWSMLEFSHINEHFKCLWCVYYFKVLKLQLVASRI